MTKETNPVRGILTTLAALGSIVYGLLSMMSPMTFAANEPTSHWAAAGSPVLLVVPTVASYWLPRAGLAVYVTLIGAAMLLDASPWDAQWRWRRGWDEFAMGWAPVLVCLVLLAISAWLAAADLRPLRRSGQPRRP